MKRSFYKYSKIGPITLYRLGLGPLIGRLVLLLTTTGRKSGLPRVTPLQYELIDGAYYVGAALGLKADWLRNLQADPRVRLSHLPLLPHHIMILHQEHLQGHQHADDLFLVHFVGAAKRIGIGIIVQLSGLDQIPAPQQQARRLGST